MNLKPLYDRVIIKPKQIKNTNNFGIIIPELAEQKSCIGTVMAIGNGQTFDGESVSMQVEIGDTVLYSKFANTEIEYKGEEYLVLRQADVLAVIGKE